MNNCQNFPMKNTFYREVNEDNVLIRNVLVEFEDSLKYVSIAYFALKRSIIVHFYRAHARCTDFSKSGALSDAPYRISYAKYS